MPQGIQRHSRITLHRSTHPKWKQELTEKSSYGLIDYKKTYDNISRSWIINCLKMHKISHETINFIEKTMKNWRVEFAAGGKSLGETKIQRGIFQGDALSHLLFIIAMMPLNHILRKYTAGYKLSRSQEKINHLMYMDDIKLFAKNEKGLETLIHTVRIYSQDIGMEFGIERCALLVMKSRKRHLTDGIELANQDKIKTLTENETYKYLRILDTIKQVEMKNKIQKEYLRRTRKLLETKLNSRNLIKGINTWAVRLVRYSGPFLKWTRDELRQMDQRTRKLMTMHKALHPRDDVDRLYVPRKEGGRGLTSIEDSVDTSIQRLEDYIEKHERGLITAIRNNTDNTIDSRMTKTRKQKWEGKQLHGCFKRLINNIPHDKTWTWLRKGNFKRETESLLMAAHNSAIRNNDIKARIDKTQQNSKCWLCGDRDETINYIISEYSKLAQKEYKARHDLVGKVIHWEMCKKFKFNLANKWYMHNPAPVLENGTHKLLWDFDIQTDHLISARRPDLIIINKKKRICKIVDFAVPADHRIKLKECEKKDKYLDLARELKKLWNIQVTIIPIVIGAFGIVTSGLLKGLEDLEVDGWVETIQTTTLLRTARILRTVLETWEDFLSLRLQWKNHQLTLMRKTLMSK